MHRVPALPSSLRGLTLSPFTVLLTPPAPERMLIHELVHTVQIRDTGQPWFAMRYLAEWYRGLFEGCSLDDARRGISFELQASRTANRLEGKLESSLLEEQLAMRRRR